MAETEQQRLARIDREELTWTGPKFIGLLFVTVFFALCVIYTIASYPTQSRPFWDFRWYPTRPTSSPAPYPASRAERTPLPFGVHRAHTRARSTPRPVDGKPVLSSGQEIARQHPN
jgi:hypothetical protein